MGFDATGKKVLITGASSGIGAALAEGFSAAGATVGICARREDRLAAVLDQCQRHAPASRMWTLDLADPAAIDRLIEAAPEELGGIDVLVNNAGIPQRRHVTKLDAATVERTMAINYLSPVRLTLGLLPHLRQRPEAWIVNISSVAATLSSPGEAAYDASKAALTAFSEAMAMDLWDTTVHVLVVCPGLVATELLDAPDNEPVVAGIPPIGCDEVVSGVLGALEAGTTQLYVPGWFKDVAITKATDLDSFIAGAAAYVRDRTLPPGEDGPWTKA
jgi:NAD(P)-dependent dehydrogenase (short-subunit alcohol dehydrogenase family)